jgi:hypothetical protein
VYGAILGLFGQNKAKNSLEKQGLFDYALSFYFWVDLHVEKDRQR